MESQSFYERRDPRKAVEVFLESHNTLDDRMREYALKRFLRNNLPSVKGKDILDVGAGGGIWTRFWLNEGANVTALDKHGPILLGNKMRNPKAEYVEADAVTVKLTKRFDVIFAKDLIEHLPDDIAFLQNMSDHLKEEGYLLLTTQNSCSLTYLIEGSYNFYRVGNKKWCGFDPTHVRFYNFRHLNNKLRMTGLMPLKYWSTYHLPYRFLTGLLFKRIVEWKSFHLVELLNLNSYFPFNLTGWNIGVLAKRSVKISK